MKHLRYEKEFSFMRLVFLFSFSTNLWGSEGKFSSRFELINLSFSTDELDNYIVTITFLPFLIIFGFRGGY